jgi:predicted nucleic acid-binding protein
MQIVIDTSAVMAVILNEDSKPAIVEATIDTTLSAPGSLHWEVGNALSSLLKRRRITLEEALMALFAYQSISLRMVDVDLEVVLKLADEMGIYAYDAYMLVCADSLKSPLLTLDKSMMRLAQDKGLKLMEVGDA